VVMQEVKHFARLAGVWEEGCCTLPAVTNLWSKIWPSLEPTLRTLTTKSGGEVSCEKSRQGQMAWRTGYNKILKERNKGLPPDEVGEKGLDRDNRDVVDNVTADEIGEVEV